jgi:hypothetical protein
MSLLSTISAGTLTPMVITAYSDDTYSSSVGTYTAYINPDQYTYNYSIEYSKQDVPGAGGQTLKFQQVEPATVTFDMYFDTTGIIPDSSGDVNDQIADFQAITYGYNGDIHSPNYLQLVWGTMIFNGVLGSLSVTYQLFSPQGIPLRAKASVTFKNTADPEEIEKEENSNSPDMTHVRTVLEGDTLPLMCNRIYGDPSLYMEVARVNGLDQLTDLKAGTSIVFPPIVP